MKFQLSQLAKDNIIVWYVSSTTVKYRKHIICQTHIFFIIFFFTISVILKNVDISKNIVYLGDNASDNPLNISNEILRLLLYCDLYY